tara:strand:+ start:96762 stop:97187 length:426 start_codon:yes stop_codon:yes gene_type:complete
MGILDLLYLPQKKAMKKALLFLVLTFYMFSCSDNEDNAMNPLNGNWNMKSYTATVPNPPVLENGDIIWKINNGNLTVDNNVEDEYPYMLQSGFYPIEQGEQKITISIAGGDSEWNYTRNDNELILSGNSGPNAPIIRFKKR